MFMLTFTLVVLLLIKELTLLALALNLFELCSLIKFNFDDSFYADEVAPTELEAAPLLI